MAFASEATTWSPATVNGVQDVFVHSLATGVTTRASVPDVGGLARDSDSYVLSGDGRSVAFTTDAAAVAGDTNGWLDVFVRDLAGGTTRRVSVGPAGRARVAGPAGARRAGRPGAPLVRP